MSHGKPLLEPLTHLADAARLLRSMLHARAAGRRTLLARKARTLLLERQRTDLAALGTYVTALEHDALTDPELKRKVLVALAHGLQEALHTSGDAGTAHRELLERIHRNRPGLAFPRVYLGYRRYGERDFQTASQLFDGLPGRLASHPLLLLIRARCADNLGEHDRARELYERSFTRWSTHAHAHIGVGRLLLTDGLETAPPR